MKSYPEDRVIASLITFLDRYYGEFPSDHIKKFEEILNGE